MLDEDRFVRQYRRRPGRWAPDVVVEALGKVQLGAVAEQGVQIAPLVPGSEN